MFGRAAVSSFVWSLALLLMGLLISAHKAGWFALPMRRELTGIEAGKGGDGASTDGAGGSG
jgi:hypothetical protein